MSSHSTALVQKLWNYCNILRDDGLSYGDYVTRQRIMAKAERRLSAVDELENLRKWQANDVKEITLQQLHVSALGCRVTRTTERPIPRGRRPA